MNSQTLEQHNFNAGVLAAIQGLQDSINSTNSRINSVHRIILSSNAEGGDVRKDVPQQTQAIVSSAKVDEMRLSQWRSTGEQLCMMYASPLLSVLC